MQKPRRLTMLLLNSAILLSVLYLPGITHAQAGFKKLRMGSS